jgi:outer membrane protein W
VARALISCTESASCQSHDWSFGLQADYHFAPDLKFDPYVGLGSGYEILHTHVEVPTTLPPAAGSLSGTSHGVHELYVVGVRGTFNP